MNLFVFFLNRTFIQNVNQRVKLNTSFCNYIYFINKTINIVFILLTITNCKLELILQDCNFTIICKLRALCTK